MGKKQETHFFKRMFGVDDYGFSIIPPKYSNIEMSRLRAIIEDNSVCSFCFPHGFETKNSHIRNRQRSWKEFRKNQYKQAS
jgi:hypothetical protein